jgi:sec-independent protein translocase protein TatA
MPRPGPVELIVILAIALLLNGPGKLPEFGGAIGRGIREFRRAASDAPAASDG